jgi:CRP-like cAMP-binding protein
MPDRDKREEYLREFQEGEMLLDFDQKVDRFFVLKEGVLSAHLRDGEVRELAKPDTYFAALFGFLGDPSFARIVAAKPSRVYVFPAEMSKLVEISPEVANTLVKKLLILIKKREKQLQEAKATHSQNARSESE